MVSALFRYLDLDGDGFLQHEELQKVYNIIITQSVFDKSIIFFLIQ